MSRRSLRMWRAAPVASLIALTTLVAARAQEQKPAPDLVGAAAAEDRGATLADRRAWLYNSRERTQAALRALETEQPDAAIAAATIARDLDSGGATGGFNLGTVRLLAGDNTGAAEHLTVIAESDSALATDAAYNLGGAHQRQQELDQAIRWYEETLRRDPTRLEAKINLELALQQRQQQQPQDQEQEQTQPEEQMSEEKGPESSAGEDDGEEEQDATEAQQPQSNRQADEEPSRLPQFEPRPDMTAEEAASLLEAVEAMEREARAEMRPEARQAAPGDRDW